MEAQMKTSLPAVYEPLKEELLSHTIKTEPLPDIYNLIKEEVIKQEAFFTNFYAKEEVVETSNDDPNIYPKLSPASAYTQQNPSTTPSPDSYPAPTVTSATTPLTEQKENVPPISHPQQHPFMGHFTSDYSYIPHFYSYPAPYIPFAPANGVNSHTPTPTPTLAPTPSYNSTPHPSYTTFHDQTNIVSGSTSSSFGKMKRIRTDFTQAHLDVLEESFSKSQYMRGLERDDLARKLKVTPKSVTIWFQNRRARMRAEKRQTKFIKQAAETGSSNVGAIPDYR